MRRQPAAYYFDKAANQARQANDLKGQLPILIGRWQTQAGGNVNAQKNHTNLGYILRKGQP
jgi:hypothetical protein